MIVFVRRSVFHGRYANREGSALARIVRFDRFGGRCALSGGRAFVFDSGEQQLPSYGVRVYTPFSQQKASRIVYWPPREVEPRAGAVWTHNPNTERQKRDFSRNSLASCTILRK